MVSQPFFCFTTQLTSSSSVSKYTAINNTSVLEFPTAFYTLWPLASHMCFQTSFATYSCNYIFYISYETHSNITFTLTVLWIFFGIILHLFIRPLFCFNFKNRQYVSCPILSPYNIPTCKCRQPLGNRNKLILFKATKLALNKGH